MAENDKTTEPAVVPPAAEGAPPVPPKRSPGHRGADVKDTVAEMAAKAHEISLEAGTRMSAAMKDVVNAAAGLTGFVMESATDLVQFMVRRGQMTQEEADKLIRQVEEHQPRRKPTVPPPAAKPEPVRHAPSHVVSYSATTHKPAVAHTAPTKKAAPAKVAKPVKTAKPAKVAKAAKPLKSGKAGKAGKSVKPAKPSKPVARKAAKPAPKKAAARKPTPKKPAAKKAPKRK